MLQTIALEAFDAEKKNGQTPHLGKSYVFDDIFQTERVKQ
jgi:hypothetical protein